MLARLPLLLCLLVSPLRSASEFSFVNPQGPHAVGLRVLRQYDYARSFKGSLDEVTGRPVTGERARPIQTLVWYPASGGGRPLSYGDYLGTRKTEEDLELSSEGVAARVRQDGEALRERRGAAQAAAEMQAPMRATRDAAPMPGRYPVLIYAPGAGGAAHENADLCEYLAGHGYLVIASTSMGVRGKGMSFGQEDVDAQVGDIEFLIGFARSLPQADMAHLAVMGWSWGGMSNVFAAARDSRISALVSFDGTREPALTKQIPPQRLTVPWLYVSRTPSTIPELNKRGIETSFSLLNEAKYADVYQVTMYPMVHEDFTSAHLRLAPDSDFTEYTRGEVSQAYGWVARYTLRFLDAHLKGEAQASAFMNSSPTRNGVPAHMMLAEVHRAEGPAPTREAFAAELARRGFGQAAQVYQEMHARSPGFALSEGELKAWGYALLARSEVAAAAGIFKLWATLHPENWDAFDSLGEACAAAGNTALAVESYQRSLELNPKNDGGARALAALRRR